MTVTDTTGPRAGRVAQEPVPQIHHVGRRGEVAGGMTQVVNGYLDWDFERCRVAVIVSRDGGTGPKALALFVRAAIAVARLPRTDSLAVVHLSQGGSFVREGALLLLAHLRGVPVVAHLHGSAFVAFARRRRRLVRTVLRAADAVHALSDASVTAAEAVLRRGPGRTRPAVVLVPNAVPAGHPAAGAVHKERRVVFGGAVSRRKGVDVLVEAWRQVGVGRGWTLDVVGPVLDPEIVPAELPDAVFHGARPHAELMTLLERAAIAVLPSRDEALPMFVLEALARDACVITTDVGGLPDALEGGAGRLVPAGDVAALARTLDTLLSSDAERAETVRLGAQRFEDRYAAASVYPAMEQLWLATIEDRRTGRAPSKRSTPSF